MTLAKHTAHEIHNIFERMSCNKHLLRFERDRLCNVSQRNLDVLVIMLLHIASSNEIKHMALSDAEKAKALIAMQKASLAAVSDRVRKKLNIKISLEKCILLCSYAAEIKKFNRHEAKEYGINQNEAYSLRNKIRFILSDFFAEALHEYIVKNGVVL